MKKILLSVTMAALIASPALAQTVHRHSANHRAAVYQPMPADQLTQYGYGPGVVIVGGKIAGQDPDPNIQLQLRRDPIADY